MGLFAAGECAAGINGANRLGGNSSAFGHRYFWKTGLANTRPNWKKETAFGAVDQSQVERVSKEALAPFEREDGENPSRGSKGLFRK